MGTAFRARTLYCNKMKFLLVCAVISAASAAPQVALPYGYGLGLGGLGYGYGGYGFGGYPLTYAAPHVIKPVPKEIEVPVKPYKFEVAETGCKNSFGFQVPCLEEGEARKKREAAEEEAAPATPAGLPYGAGLTYAAVKPTVTEVEVPTFKYVPEVETINYAPACHNGFGFPVPCA